jgi:transposase-like protein
MLTGSSIEKCALGVKISIQTSFDWRHKIIAALEIMYSKSMVVLQK